MWGKKTQRLNEWIKNGQRKINNCTRGYYKAPSGEPVRFKLLPTRMSFAAANKSTAGGVTTPNPPGYFVLKQRAGYEQFTDGRSMQLEAVRHWSRRAAPLQGVYGHQTERTGIFVFLIEFRLEHTAPG